MWSNGELCGIDSKYISYGAGKYDITEKVGQALASSRSDQSVIGTQPMLTSPPDSKCLVRGRY